MSRFRKTKERLFVAVIWFLAFLTIAPLVHIIGSLAVKGLGTFSLQGLPFLFRPLSEGGIGPAIVGTMIITGLAGLFGLPIALLAGVYAFEKPGTVLGKLVKGLLQIMMEFPTILVGIFVMGVLVVPMGKYSGLAASFALSIIVIPYVAIYTHEALRSVPFTYKEAAYALGFSETTVIFKVLFPIAKRGVLTGVLIGLAKAAGETAPLLFTAGGLYETFPKSIVSPVGAIPLLIYNLIQSPDKFDHLTAWGASFVLLGIFLLVFIPIRLSMKEVKL